VTCSRLQLRAVRIGGVYTTVKLEPEFWEGLDRICVERGLTAGKLMLEIDAGRNNQCLRASAVRSFILKYILREKISLYCRQIQLLLRLHPGDSIGLSSEITEESIRIEWSESRKADRFLVDGMLSEVGHGQANPTHSDG
jgi:predicted DNA-binding ribbon-helix-helix protein